MFLASLSLSLRAQCERTLRVPAGPVANLHGVPLGLNEARSFLPAQPVSLVHTPSLGKVRQFYCRKYYLFSGFSERLHRVQRYTGNSVIIYRSRSRPVWTSSPGGVGTRKGALGGTRYSPRRCADNDDRAKQTAGHNLCRLATTGRVCT